MTRRVVVLGGGAGGLSAANRLARGAGRSVDGLEVVLIDRSADHVFAPGYVAVMFGEAEAGRFLRPLSGLAAPSVRLVHGDAERIDPASRLVEGSFGELGYDWLVVALGADVGWPGTPPAGDTAPWTGAGAEAGRSLLDRLGPGTRLLVAPSTPTYRCPPALFDLAVRIRTRTGAGVALAHPWPRPLAPFGEEPSRRFEAMLEGAGVGYHGGFSLEEVAPGSARSAAGETIGFDEALLVPPHRPPAVVASSPLAGPEGWMAVAYPGLSHPSFPEVYGVGDVVAPSLRVGMAGTLAVFEASFVADRILEAAGGPPAPPAPGMSAICFVDTGSTGSFLHCDFGQAAAGTGPPRCTLMPDLAYFRAAKRVFAEEWFSTILTGEAG